MQLAMFRNGIIIITSVLCWTQATALDSDSVFIPYTPLTAQGLDEYKAALINDHGWRESEAEKLVEDGSGEIYKFTDADIRKAFPKILPGDKQTSLCSNSIMGGETSLVYLSPASGNTVTVKSSMCRPSEGGLSCELLSEHESYFFESPDYRFALGDGVSYDEAIEVLAIFRDRGLGGLPDWYERQQFSYRDVTSIGKTDGVYKLTLGEFFCRGCIATFKVVIETSEGQQSALRLVEEPEGMCI